MFVEQRRFSKRFYVQFDCRLDTPVKILLPKVQIELKKIMKNSTKRLTFFPQILHLIYCKLVENAREKRYLSKIFAKVKKYTLKLITLTRLLWIESAKSFFSLCQSLREGFFSLSKTLNLEKLSSCEKIRSSLPKKSSSTEFDGSIITVVAGNFFRLNPRLNALQKASAHKLHFLPKDW